MYEKRKQIILELLEENGHVSVKEIRENTKVSSMTVLRDVTKMEEEGLVVKGFGEISKVKGIHLERLMATSYQDSQKEQAVISELAAHLLEDGDTAIFGNGNVIAHYAKAVCHKNIIAVTPSMRAAFALCKGEANVYLSGGNLTSNMKSLYGEYAEGFIKNFHADKAFITCGGINTHGDLCDFSESEVSMKRSIMACAKKTYLLIEEDKIGYNAFFTVGDFSSVNCIVTDKKPTDFFMKLFKKGDIEVMYPLV